MFWTEFHAPEIFFHQVFFRERANSLTSKPEFLTMDMFDNQPSRIFHPAPVFVASIRRDSSKCPLRFRFLPYLCVV